MSVKQTGLRFLGIGARSVFCVPNGNAWTQILLSGQASSAKAASAAGSSRRMEW